MWDYYPTQDKQYPLKMRVTTTTDGKSTPKYYPLNFFVKKNEWDKKSRRVRTDIRVNGQDINIKIMELENAIERAYLNDRNADIQHVINTILDPNYQVQYDPISYFEKYVADCEEGLILHHKTGQPLAVNYTKTFTTAAGRLKEFRDKKRGGKLPFTAINKDFYSEFVTYLRNDYNKSAGVKENTIGTTIKRMITVFKKARKDGHLKTDDFENFIIITQETDAIALLEPEIKKIIDADVTKKPHLAKERIRFLVAYNFLLRFNDSISVNKKHFTKEGDRYFFKITTQKTREGVYIPVMPIVYEALKANKFKLNPISNQKSNDNLKDLGKLAKIDSDYTMTEYIKGKKVETVYKKWELITTHTTRRSAATNMYLAGIDLVTIKTLGGWRTIRQLMDYIKVEKLENARKVATHAFFN